MLLPRRREAEWMDQPGLDDAEHRRALKGLKAINRASRTAAALWQMIEPLARERRPTPLSVLDAGCGGGDVAIGLARRASAAGAPLAIHGCDISRTAIEHARQQAHTQRIANADFFPCDLFLQPLGRQFDVVFCTLLLHHLDEPQAVRLLQIMAAAAGEMLLVDDLRRTRWGLVLATVACRVLSRSPIVHFDGPRSVRAAFTGSEALELARRAGLRGAQLQCHWPQRFLLSWRPL